MVVEFASLGGDAVLVAPCERGPRTQYAHLGAFVREASALNKLLSGRLLDTLSSGLLLTVATVLRPGCQRKALVYLGYIRLDSRPKYYHHAAYEQSPRIVNRMTGLSRVVWRGFPRSSAAFALLRDSDLKKVS